MSLIWKLLFYKPVWTKENQNQHNIRFIYVNFSAWHFAGCDLLWTKMAIGLFHAMQMNFGKLALALFLVTQFNKEEVKKQGEKEKKKNWIPKKVCCCPWWLVILFIIIVPIFLVVGIFVWGLTKAHVNTEEQRTDTNSEVDALKKFFITLLGVPAVGALRFVLPIGKNLIFSQATKIKKELENDQKSNKQGSRNQVREGISFLTQFIKFMEVFERRRIRIVLKITNLDRCSPSEIVAVLEAIDILISEKKSPVLSIIALNPNVLLQKVKAAKSCFCKEDRAHVLLNRVVTLAFTVPPMSGNLKQNLFQDITSSSEISEEIPMDMDQLKVSILMDNKNTLYVEEDKLEKMVKRILSNAEKKLNKYMLDDAISRKRMINSVWVTWIIMKILKKEFPAPEHTAAWVVLANQWPCRFSWIIQCVEDEKQRAAIDQQNMSTDDSKTLWKVFSESREELYVMRAHIQDLLEQDGDPEMFEALLKDKEFEFTLKTLEIFQVAMVNLDHSIRRELALIRGTSRLKDSGWMRNVAPLPVTSLIKMTTEDICKEMERMKLEKKYIDTVKDHKINGSALVFGDAEDLKALLGMTFGEWATFKLHFCLTSPATVKEYGASTFQDPAVKVPPSYSP
ncbi:NTPase KAP family P-loop domain-containing protein 1-like [Fundulus heteroclitus]|uniref:NTPase KAP family P-loop domain-containing protein 1-like n=1 Tax=Fundulus heteroclitus TaxID=8078 RepID=UPI00165B6A1B|nr:NTPase KAP family P-loop domain-containing protein 1-like [Fundulus heteroclitus]